MLIAEHSSMIRNCFTFTPSIFKQMIFMMSKLVYFELKLLI
jgi:hypothetical protein